MPRSNAFQPIWPPVEDDRFELQPEFRQARRIFSAQLARLRDLATGVIETESGGETRQSSQELAALLHNISGTAAFFDHADFGELAAAIEQPVRAAFTAQLLRPYCEQILSRLDPEACD